MRRAPAVSCESLAAIVYAFEADFIECLRQQSVSICFRKLGISLSQSKEGILSIEDYFSPIPPP